MTDDDPPDFAQKFLAAAARRGPQAARLLGKAIGSVLPTLDVSKTDRSEAISREFAEGVEEGKLLRSLGDLLRTGTTTRKKKEDAP
jgi:hypothetical protein